MNLLRLISVFVIIITIPFVSIGQITSEPLEINIDSITTENTDSLKDELSKLQLGFSSLLLEIEELNSAVISEEEREKKNEQLRTDIRKKQIEAIRLCSDFTARFAQGAKSTDVILDALSTGIELGELSSPFDNTVFSENYDNWVDKWGKFIPAIILPTASLLTDNDNLQTASIPIGISLTALINALTKKKKDNAISEKLQNVTATMDLFDLNRTVYGDIQKLKSSINSVSSSDSTLVEEFTDYWQRNKDLFSLSDEQILLDKRFSTYIDSSTVYFDRFQLKLTRVNYVLDFASGMINSYNVRYDYVNQNDDLSSNDVFTATKKAIDDLNTVYSNFRENWNNLQGTFYSITPIETRKFNAFYQLENLFNQIGE